MKIASLCFFLFSWSAVCAASPMGVYDPDAKNWNVSGAHFQCTFFHGCMYPVWFRSPGQQEYPFFLFTDSFSDGKKTYRIEEERWAEATVVENTETRFIIELKGNFCDGLPPHNTPCKEVTAVYRYTLERNVPDLRISCTFSKTAERSYEMALSRLRWRFLPFEKFAGKDGVIALRERFKRPGELKTAGGTLLSPVMNLTLLTDSVLLRWENLQNGFFHLADGNGVLRWGAGEKILRYSVTMRFSNPEKDMPK